MNLRIFIPIALIIILHPFPPVYGQPQGYVLIYSPPRVYNVDWMDVKAIYMKEEGEKLYFRVEYYGAIPNSEDYVRLIDIYIDADRNCQTGGLYNGLGNDYIIRFSLSGDSSYSRAELFKWDSTIEYYEDIKDLTLNAGRAPGLSYMEIWVDKRDIGYTPDGIDFYIDTYFEVEATLDTELNYVIDSSVKYIEIDGYSSDWGSISPSITLPPKSILLGFEVSSIYVANDDENLYFRIDMRGRPTVMVNKEGLYYGFLVSLDTDNNDNTGYYRYGGSEFGVDAKLWANLLKDTEVDYYRYIGTGSDFNWKLIWVSSTSVDFNDVFELKIPLGLLEVGSGQTVGIYMRGVLGRFIPESGYLTYLSDLQTVIQQRAKEIRSVVVDGSEYYIVTLEKFIDPVTLESSDHSFLAVEPHAWEVYTYTNFQPISDESLLRKIWTIDRANKLLKRIGSPEYISDNINIINNVITTSKGLSEAYNIEVWGKTGIFMVVDLVIFAELELPVPGSSLGTILKEQISHYTDPVRFLLEAGRALLEASKKDYQKAREIAESHRDGISDYETARNYLNYYYNGYFKFLYGTSMALPTGEIDKSVWWTVVSWIPDYIIHLGQKALSSVGALGKIASITKDVSDVTVNMLETHKELREYIDKIGKIEKQVNILFESESLYIDYTLALIERSKERLYEKWGIHGIDEMNSHLCSPAELRVCDSQGRITGLVNGEVRMEIPNSYYFYTSRIVTIFFPSDTHIINIVGTEEGTYGLEVTYSKEGKTITFTARDIHITPKAVHQYKVDWEKLSKGKNGVTVEVDSDGDGKFDWSFTGGKDINQGDFTSHLVIPYLWVIGVVITFILITIIIAHKRKFPPSPPESS
ncbi:hypothetical protein [Candidatus Methanodesulfokora washburnensis]|uniref:Uncharacterized protein n=1 Tax=Candidatus Methanodesulfokora washburnensis TaxID=2478471 RepID=A0A429GM28_9CREN|nr:hypothetical protein [Candidatus Methanodesulfokores washburnensis]RSN74831.1 hypothetical protein D6D85_07390 [Candidatus Methanodesulfokores washburnensis]